MRVIHHNVIKVHQKSKRKKSIQVSWSSPKYYVSSVNFSAKKRVFSTVDDK